ncbi:DNA-binding protein [Hwanghaeella grinnelliae]|uniref:DNA-binding protein n=1 Tax=Hwanghaeella grinnelliae TaxID=2500179 RepID=A0A3S2VMG1_9PROT|nr:DNA-binding protein [Hwanghaeella grinnelliae]
MDANNDNSVLLMTTEEAAPLLRMSARKLKRLAAERKIGHVNFDNRYLFRPSDITNFIDQHRVAACPSTLLPPARLTGPTTSPSGEHDFEALRSAKRSAKQRRKNAA